MVLPLGVRPLVGWASDLSRGKGSDLVVVDLMVVDLVFLFHTGTCHLLGSRGMVTITGRWSE